VSLLQHAHKEWIEQNQLLPRFFQLFNITGKDKYLVFHQFVLGMAILQGKSKLISTEQFVFEIFAVNDLIRDTHIDAIFPAKDLKTQEYVAITKYYIYKWDTTKKGYLTYDDFIKGMTNMNPVNKDFLLHILYDYQLLYENH
jgi:hypothetical protein